MPFASDHLKPAQNLSAQPDQGRWLSQVVNIDGVQIGINQVDEARLHAHHLGM